MKKFALALAALALAALALTGCGFFAAGDSAGDAEGETALLDPLTGEADLWAGSRPASVVIHNGVGAGRQWGLGEASVAIEALTEGDGATSLCLVYRALEAMPKAGPVAQGRDLYLQLLTCQQTISVQRGASLYAANLIDQYGLDTLDALSLGLNGFVYEGAWGQPDEVSWTTSGDLLAPLAEAAGISLTVQPDALPAEGSAGAAETAQLPPLLPFGEPEGGREGASSVQVVFSAEASTSFSYDEASGQYLMARADGSPQTDENTGAQAAFDNLFILYSAPTRRDDGYTWGYDLTMGAGVYLNGGSVWSILWMPGVDSTLAIYSSDGTSLSVRTGSSYIALMGSVAGQELILRDSQGGEMTAG